jgi:hypothetical protein
MYDAFISYASEDKEKFVRQLAQKLREKNISIWFDEFSLKVGDSLRKSIDKGLKESKYGIVVFSPYFFEKNWPVWELDGLIQLQNKYRKKKILPILHNITHDEIIEYSPSIADIYSISSSLGIEYVVQKLLEIIKPEGSSLTHAYHILDELGYNPPPVTEEWWLDVIEYDGSDANVYDWSFFIGLLPDKPKDRGEFLAKKVIQRKWQEVVLEKNISQTTKPDILLNIIESTPGLKELLIEHLPYTICYAPQLKIPGFGGLFEPYIEEYYNQSLKKHMPRDKKKSGTGITIDGLSPSCDQEIALRDSNFGYYRPSHVTCDFVQGDIFGPSPNVYDHFEYLIWLLTKDSSWLPEKIRNYLIEGFRDWNVWLWFTIPKRHPHDIKRSKFTGKLQEQMFKTADSDKNFAITQSAIKDLKERVAWSLQILEINDDIDSLIEKFLSSGFIESYIDEIRNRSRMNKSR